MNSEITEIVQRRYMASIEGAQRKSDDTRTLADHFQSQADSAQIEADDARRKLNQAKLRALALTLSELHNAPSTLECRTQFARLAEIGWEVPSIEFVCTDDESRLSIELLVQQFGPGRTDMSGDEIRLDTETGCWRVEMSQSGFGEGESVAMFPDLEKAIDFYLGAA